MWHWNKTINHLKINWLQHRERNCINTVSLPVLQPVDPVDPVDDPVHGGYQLVSSMKAREHNENYCVL